jgi:hypothetical protein
MRAFFFSLFLLPLLAQGQHDTTKLPVYKPKRLFWLSAVSGTAYAGSMIALSQLWYAENGLSGFRFFNDNGEWLQMDKVGHFYTSYQYSRAAVALLRWTGTKDKKAIWYGGSMGFLLQLPIEILDGMSPDYGFSWGDITANALGSAGVIAQELAWKEQRILPKFSFYPSEWAELRPELLGETPAQQLVKDYNAQTYWLAFNMRSLTKVGVFPKWFCLSLGYSGEGMVYGDRTTNSQEGYTAYRQYFLAFDVNLSAIKSKSRFLNTLLFAADILHIPGPALEFSQDRVTFHPIYY